MMAPINRFLWHLQQDSNNHNTLAAEQLLDPQPPYVGDLGNQMGQRSVD